MAGWLRSILYHVHAELLIQGQPFELAADKNGLRMKGKIEIPDRLGIRHVDGLVLVLFRGGTAFFTAVSDSYEVIGMSGSPTTVLTVFERVPNFFMRFSLTSTVIQVKYQ